MESSAPAAALALPTATPPPRRHRAAGKRDELAALHSIASSVQSLRAFFVRITLLSNPSL
jgi:hypothetical protein